MSSGLLHQPAQLWRWWTRELAGLWKERPFRSGQRDPASFVYLRQGQVLIELRSDGAGERYAEERPFEQLSPEDFAQLLELTAGTSIKIQLDAPDVHITTVTLPGVAATRAEAAVELQLGVIAPIRPELLDWVTGAVERDEDHVRVSVAMAKRSRLEQIQTTLIANGIDTASIGPAAWPAIAFGTGHRSGSDLATMLRRPWLIVSLFALASIPLTTIVGSAILAARADSRAEAMQETARQNRKAIKTAIDMEERRRATQPLFGQADAATLLDALARKLPSSDWLRSIQRQADGSLTFIVSTKDDAALDTALRGDDLLPGLHVVDQSPGGEGATDVTYQTDRP